MNTMSGAAIDPGTVEVAAATVIGGDHRRADRPCQDAFAIRRGPGAVVAVACDGCGSGAHSELGARLGAHLFAGALHARLAVDDHGGVADPAAWRAACDDVVAALAAVAETLGGGDRAIGDHLLFTIVAAAVTPAGAAAVVIGDGVVIVDGEPRVVAEEAPPYLAYELVGRRAALDLTVAPGASSIVVATDGAAALLDRAGEPLPAGRGPVLDLRRAAADDRLFANPDALRRRLAVASQEVIEVDPATGRVVRRAGPLTDDTTVVALRWRRP